MARTEMARSGIGFDEARRRQIASIPAGRMGRPEELADACAFLCSANAGYISGQNLHIDGGAHTALI
jgi:3-oxoacyl-[acyl-carrier protein] reductase